MRPEEPENWELVYSERVDVYEAFANSAEEGLVVRSLLGRVSFFRKTVLEIGCGSGNQTTRLAPLSQRYVALDISAPMLRMATEKCRGLSRLTFVRSDARHLPLQSQSVDIVFSGWALDAIWPPQAREEALAEVERVLAIEGHVWALGNHWQGEFMEMRGRTEVDSERGNYEFMLNHGFEHVDTIETAFLFPSLQEAKRILGFIFGPKALEYLKRNPEPRLGHRVVLYHKRRLG